MRDHRKQLMVAGQTGPLPEFDLRLTIDAQNYFAADHVDAWISMDPVDVDRADYLIIPGGAPDISPSLYGEENKGSHDVDEDLDRIQLSIIDRAVQQRKPILGICRGVSAGMRLLWWQYDPRPERADSPHRSGQSPLSQNL